MESPISEIAPQHLVLLLKCIKNKEDISAIMSRKFSLLQISKVFSAAITKNYIRKDGVGFSLTDDGQRYLDANFARHVRGSGAWIREVDRIARMPGNPFAPYVPSGNVIAGLPIFGGDDGKPSERRVASQK